jgi:glutamyl-tRNA synthetase
MSVVTRFPPSPSGSLHIGGARTALYNWAYARHHGGRFLLRIEDTDRARSTLESEQGMLEGLAWLGLDHDPIPGFDGIPRQSERGERYREAVEQLVAGGHAYRCTCTPEEVEAMREQARALGRNPGYDGSCRDRDVPADTGDPYCVRLRVPADGATRWSDGIAGPSGQEADQIDDFVIARTDGTPIYHLAVVIDDHDMGVTDVIRGREHLASTPRQLLLYDALGWEPPRLAHVPLLVEPGGKKLSKRHAAVSVQSYRERGFVPEAVLNFIARLGWGHGDMEIVSRDELARLFELEDVGKSPSGVSEEKLLWLSQHYLKTLPRERLLDDLAAFLAAEAGRPVEVDAGLADLVDLLRERSRTLVDMAERARFYLLDSLEFEEKAARKHLRPQALAPLRDLRGSLQKLDAWDLDGLRASFEATIERQGIALGKLAQPVRVAVTGRAESPGIFETLACLGRERTLTRLTAAIERIETAGDDSAGQD